MRPITIGGFLSAAILLSSFHGTAGEKESQASRVDRIHKKILTVDSHADTPLNLTREGFDVGTRNDPYTTHTKVDFPRMKEGGLDAAFFAVFLSQGKRSEDANVRAKNRADMLFDTIFSAVKRNSAAAGIALNPGDAFRLKKEGRSAVFIGMENGYPIGKDISLIQYFYDRGARYITLCHTKNNEICDSSTDTTEWGGLSEFGKNVILVMNKVGMMIDLSHASDCTFYDVLNRTKAPVIASHSCARALCDNPRNLDDAMLKALAQNGGVVQMCILSDYVRRPDPNPTRDSAYAALRKKYRNFTDLTEEEGKNAHRDWDEFQEKFPMKLAELSDVADHIDHMVAVAGIRHVGIGTDFDGGGAVNGCFDVSQMKNITSELVRRGYSDRDIKLIWGGNLMRVMKDVQRVSKKMSRNCGCN